MDVIITEGTIGHVLRMKADNETEIRIFRSENSIGKFRVFIVIKMKNMLKWEDIDEIFEVLEEAFSKNIF